MKINRFICYTATHNKSGLVYVGVSSKMLEQRKQDHKHGAKGRKGRFLEAIREFGVDAFSWTVVAETEGFEPSRQFPAYSLSRGAPSTTRPRLRDDY